MLHIACLYSQKHVKPPYTAATDIKGWPTAAKRDTDRGATLQYEALRQVQLFNKFHSNLTTTTLPPRPRY